MELNVLREEGEDFLHLPLCNTIGKSEKSFALGGASSTPWERRDVLLLYPNLSV